MAPSLVDAALLLGPFKVRTVVAKQRRRQEKASRARRSARLSDNAILRADGKHPCGAWVFPIEEGDMYAAASISAVPPGGQTTWYYWGPPGATVTVSTRRVAYTGGHRHAGGPTGSVDPARFVLGPNYPQNHPVVFGAPPASGTVQQIAEFSQGDPAVLVGENRVAIIGLIELTSGVGITLTGAKGTHPRNHFGTQTLMAQVRELAKNFYGKFRKNLFVNDLSLPDGGLYDFKNNWQTPHKTHREGRTGDINSTSMTADEKAWFRQRAAELGFSVTLETSPEHWHLFI